MELVVFKLQLCNTKLQMGLITIQLFRPNEKDLLSITEKDQNLDINSENQEERVCEQLTAINLERQIDQTYRKIPTFKTFPSPFTKKIVHNHLSHITTWPHFFKDTKMVNLIVDFLTIEQRQILKQISRNLRRIISIKTLSNQNNWNITQALLAPIIMQQTQLKQSAVDEYEHSEDLDRTSGYFQNQNTEDITQHQVKLDRIITTLSFRIKYFQGIMPICASLLQCFNQNTSYWLLRYLLFKCKYIQIDLEFYHKYINILDQELQFILPEVYAHLENSGFQINYFVMKWIMGLFSQDMPKTMVLGVWDLICQTDVYIIIYIVITVFKSFQNQILLSNSDQINQMLKTNLKSKLSKIKCEQLVRNAKQLYIKRVLEDEMLSFIKV